MATRIYRIKELTTGAVRLIEAANAAQAIKFASESAFAVDIPTTKEAITAGVPIETAAKAAPAPTGE